jgi:hypothetical protein
MMSPTLRALGHTRKAWDLAAGLDSSRPKVVIELSRSHQ